MKNNLLLQSILIILLLFTVPFKFGIFRQNKEFEFDRMIPTIIGIIEIVSALLIIHKPTKRIGLIFALCIFSGAILSHFFILGIGYGKIMFPLAILGFSTAFILFKRKF